MFDESASSNYDLSESAGMQNWEYRGRAAPLPSLSARSCSGRKFGNCDSTNADRTRTVRFHRTRTFQALLGTGCNRTRCERLFGSGGARETFRNHDRDAPRGRIGDERPDHLGGRA